MIGKYKLNDKTLSNIERALDLCLLVAKSKGRLQGHYLDNLLLTLATPITPWLQFRANAWRPPRRHWKLIDGFLREFGLLKDTEDEEPEVTNPEELRAKFDEAVSRHAVRIGKTSRELKSKTTIDEFLKDQVNLDIEEMASYRREVVATHIPNEAMKEIETTLRKLNQIQGKLRKGEALEAPKPKKEKKEGKVLPMQKAFNFSQI